MNRSQAAVIGNQRFSPNLSHHGFHRDQYWFHTFFLFIYNLPKGLIVKLYFRFYVNDIKIWKAIRSAEVIVCLQMTSFYH